jgi:hypothetical protein
VTAASSSPSPSSAARTADNAAVAVNTANSKTAQTHRTATAAACMITALFVLFFCLTRSSPPYRRILPFFVPFFNNYRIAAQWAYHDSGKKQPSGKNRFKNVVIVRKNS